MKLAIIHMTTCEKLATKDVTPICDVRVCEVAGYTPRTANIANHAERFRNFVSFCVGNSIRSPKINLYRKAEGTKGKKKPRASRGCVCNVREPSMLLPLSEFFFFPNCFVVSVTSPSAEGEGFDSHLRQSEQIWQLHFYCPLELFERHRRHSQTQAAAEGPCVSKQTDSRPRVLIHQALPRPLSTSL